MVAKKTEELPKESFGNVLGFAVIKWNVQNFEEIKYSSREK